MPVSRCGQSSTCCCPRSSRRSGRASRPSRCACRRRTSVPRERGRCPGGETRHRRGAQPVVCRHQERARRTEAGVLDRQDGLGGERCEGVARDQQIRGKWWRRRHRRVRGLLGRSSSGRATTEATSPAVSARVEISWPVQRRRALWSRGDLHGTRPLDDDSSSKRQSTLQPLASANPTRQRGRSACDQEPGPVTARERRGEVNGLPALFSHRPIVIIRTYPRGN